LIADQLQRDLTFIRIGPALPPVKILCQRYGVDYRTMRKVLHRLVADGYLRVDRRGHASRVLLQARPGSRAFLITLTVEDRPFGHLSPRSLELLRSVDDACAERGVVLDFCFGLFRGTDFSVVPSIGDVVSRYRNELTGFIFWTQGLWPHLVAGICAELRSCGLPVAVLVEDDIGEPATTAVRSVGRAVVLETGSRCGLEMGRYMTRMGHTHAAYIDYEDMEGWSQVRLAGLRQAFGEIGVSDGVHSAHIGPRNPRGLSVSDLAPARVMPAGMPRALRPMVGRAMGRMVWVLLDAVQSEQCRLGIQRRLQPLLARREITVWIAANDLIALECLTYLREQGVRVPGQISVAGFDDTLEARLRGLTSYSFNPRATAAALVDTVLRSPAVARRADPGKPCQVAGFVSERRSVARPETHA